MCFSCYFNHISKGHCPALMTFQVCTLPVLTTLNSHVSSKPTELFSKPTLTRNPPQAFEGDRVALSCKSIHLERLREDEIKYSIYKDGHPRPMGNIPGKMSIKAGPEDDGNYSCKAEAKSITKESEIIVIRSKGLSCLSSTSVLSYAKSSK